MYFAHAFGERYDLPLPLLYFVVAGAVAVIASFLLVLPRMVPTTATQHAEDGVAVGRVRRLPGLLSLLILAGLVVVGFSGSQEVAENVVPTFVWLLLWIAVPLSCGVVGDWTRSVNPFGVLARLADSATLRKAVLGRTQPLPWPSWLGWWPAAVMYFLLACGELIFNQTATRPDVTAIGLLVWALVSAEMGLLFGARAWLGRGEVFSVLFATWGRLGYLRFAAPGRRGLAGGIDVPFEPVASRLVFVMMLLVSVSFDGLISTPSWQVVRLRINSLAGQDSGGESALTVLVFVALAAVTLMVFGVFALAVARTGRHPHSFTTAFAGLLPSLLPIAFGYLLAHNLQYLLVNGQLLIPLVGNPAGVDGGQWLPAPFDDGYHVNTRLLPASVYWYAAVVVIVAAHIVAVVLAHRHLAAAGETTRHARRSEYPWLIAMVAYTMVSLWLLAQPLVQDRPAESPVVAGASITVAPR